MSRRGGELPLLESKRKGGQAVRLCYGERRLTVTDGRSGPTLYGKEGESGPSIHIRKGRSGGLAHST